MKTKKCPVGYKKVGAGCVKTLWFNQGKDFWINNFASSKRKSGPSTYNEGMGIEIIPMEDSAFVLPKRWQGKKGFTVEKGIVISDASVGMGPYIDNPDSVHYFEDKSKAESFVKQFLNKHKFDGLNSARRDAKFDAQQFREAVRDEMQRTGKTRKQILKEWE